LSRRPSNASSVSTPISATSSTSSIPKKPAKTLFLLLCEASIVSAQVIEGLLQEAFPEFHPKIYTIAVPACAPVSPTQAARLTSIYWPTLYKNTNPYGAHPAEQARRESEIMKEDGVHKWITLAERVAAEGMMNRLGLGIGCVVVERSEEYGVRVVAVAADARWCGLKDAIDCSDTSNVMGHAVMRAIGMVAQKRRIVDSKENGRWAKRNTSAPLDPTVQETEDDKGAKSDNAQLVKKINPHPPLVPIEDVQEKLKELSKLPPTITDNLDIESPPLNMVAQLGTLPKTITRFKSPITNKVTSPFLDLPLTELEATFFAPPTLLPRGYLCLNLELYTTHEPCVMCSMALLHSRFGRVVFGREMDKTGGLKAEKQATKAATSQRGGRVSDHFEDKEIKSMENPKVPTKSGKPADSRPKNNGKKQLASINTTLANNGQTPKVGKMSPAKPQSVGYGLFWRPQLNWKFLCWQWDINPKMPKGSKAKILTNGEDFDDVTDLEVQFEALGLRERAQLEVGEMVHA
jgi:tRNA-specific adenosine deaminase 3